MNFSRAKPERCGILLPLLMMTVVLMVSSMEAGDGRSIVYVGTYTGKGSEGIYAYRFDAATGELSPLGIAARTENPSFLAADPRGRFLYAVNELDTFRNVQTGAVSAYSIDRDSGKLALLQQVSSRGRGPAHLSLDVTSRFLLVANYGGGNVTVFPIRDDGRLGKSTAFIQAVGSSVNPDRQKGPHAHAIQVTSDNRFALVADLGIDKLLVYGFDAGSGTLTADSAKTCPLDAGSGPRHIAVAPSGRSVYVVNELASTVTVFSYDRGPGIFHPEQTIATRPGDATGKNTTAEILVDGRERFVYVSNRGDDTIVVFAIDPDHGSLAAVQWVSSGGKSPRNIALDPTGRWLFAANQRSNQVVLFDVDPTTGRLKPASRSVNVVSPVCVTFVPLQ